MDSGINKKKGNYEGWLIKRGNIFKTWNKRWFSLSDQIITYYISPGGKIKGMINIKDSTVEIDQESKRKYAFKIITPERTYYLCGNNDEEVNSWMNAILIATGKKITKIGIDDFEILKVLGRGSLGKVQLARYKRNNKLYALKSMSKAKLEEINLVFQTINEKNALLSINHPFIVSAKYTFQTETQVFLALDYVAGGELVKHLDIEGQKHETEEYSNTEDFYENYSEDENYSKSSSDIKNDVFHYNSILNYDDKNYGGFDLKRARIYAAQLALAIQYIHSIGFIHRDLKPSNILVDTDGYIKLTDFGFVKEKMYGCFAKTSTFCGTPMYAAPEVVMRKPYGREIDWWSFGVIVYELVFYNPPFISDNLDNLFKLISKANFGFPSKFTIEGQNNNSSSENELPFALVDFIKKLLEREPRKRLGTFDEIEVFNHPFFEGIEWKSLLQKKIQMEWKPELKNEYDVSCFSKQFTEEEPNVSFVNPQRIKVETNEAFTDFTYIDGDGIIGNA